MAIVYHYILYPCTLICVYLTCIANGGGGRRLEEAPTIIITMYIAICTMLLEVPSQWEEEEEVMPCYI